uniref:Cuticular protein 4 n=1 Tax=Leptinotarsa decemlineata TaxID=7539 RepID=A0A3S7SJL2_LEPDE|nr:cuticular protein 4 [Leptinotarsa decemlineata]
MKMIIFVLSALLAIAAAAPQQADKDAVITKYESDNIGIDGYNFNFDTSNGTSQQETGQLANAGSENEIMKVAGSYQFTWNGVTYTVTYTADENGFQAQGDHIPK